MTVYLEDNTAGTFTLLNTGAYHFTSPSVLNGTGRFFLHFSANALAIGDPSFKGLNIYTNQTERTIIIDGALINKTQAFIYDVLGREVKYFDLDTALHKNVLNVNTLSSGVYVIKLKYSNRQFAQKIILK